MNASVSIMIPLSTIIIQVPFPPLQYISHQNVPCVYCGQQIQSHVNEKEEKKEDNEIIFIKEEKYDIPGIFDDIKSEELFENFDIDERHFNHNGNIYSPISISDTEDTDNKQLSFYEYQNQFFDNLMGKCFDDIGEVIEFLKEDVSSV